MRSRLCFVLALFSLLLLEGCIPKDVAPPSAAGRFPDQPVLALAGTPGQNLSGAVARQAFTVSGGWGFRQADAFVLTVPRGRRQSRSAARRRPTWSLRTSGRQDAGRF